MIQVLWGARSLDRRMVWTEVWLAWDVDEVGGTLVLIFSYIPVLRGSLTSIDEISIVDSLLFPSSENGPREKNNGRILLWKMDP